jgi:hypothetical protein
MSKNLTILVASLFLAGCTASAQVSAGAGTGSSPAPGASSAPTGTNVGVNPAGIFMMGRKWTYNMTSVAAGQTSGGTFALECTGVSGNTATIKTTASIAGHDSTSTSTITINGSGNSFTSINAKGDSATPTLSSTKAESVTVPAGTFNTTRYTYTSSDANADSTTDQWIADGVGMVKMVTMAKPKTTVAGMDLSSTTTMELKDYTK